MSTANFDHLQSLSPELPRHGALSERFFADDAHTSLIKRRQFAEYMGKEIAALNGHYDPASKDGTNDILRRLAANQVVPREVTDVFHAVRGKGNEVVHEIDGTTGEALSALKFCGELGVWYRETYGKDLSFRAGPFVPPHSPKDVEAKTSAELEVLRMQVLEAESEAAKAKASGEDTQKGREAAEELARQATEKSAIWEQSAVQLKKDTLALEEQLAALQKQAEGASEQDQALIHQLAFEAAGKLDLDEKDTRRLIDVKLSDIGLEVDMAKLRHSKGTRLEHGRNIAIAEWPTKTGPVDYALFVEHTCVGLVEAKRESVNVPGVLTQTERYAKGIQLEAENLVDGSAWKHASTMCSGSRSSSRPTGGHSFASSR